MGEQTPNNAMRGIRRMLHFTLSTTLGSPRISEGILCLGIPGRERGTLGRRWTGRDGLFQCSLPTPRVGDLSSSASLSSPPHDVAPLHLAASRADSATLGAKRCRRGKKPQAPHILLVPPPREDALPPLLSSHYFAAMSLAHSRSLNVHQKVATRRASSTTPSRVPRRHTAVRAADEAGASSFLSSG